MARSRRKSMNDTIQPGPSDYKFDANLSLKKNPRVTIGNSRESRAMGSRAISPGPSDYAADKLKFLKNHPRATMALAAYRRTLAPREKSPGPQDYEPKKLNFKRRSSVVAFYQQKRQGLLNKTQTGTPGPGSYMLPCKFYERPTYTRIGSDVFRFV